MTTTIEKDLVVIGAGPGGYSAAFRAADLGRQVDIIDSRATLGGVCLNEGCIPSKALLHATDILPQTEHSASIGISFGKPKVNIEQLREHAVSVIGTLTNGLSQIAKRRQVACIQGTAKLIDAHRLELNTPTGAQIWQFKHLIIATGSSALSIPGWPEDDRIWDAAKALTLPTVPKHLAIVGGGIIGLEMATVYANLGSEVTVIELADQIAGGCDVQAAKALRLCLEARGVNIHTATQVSKLRCLKRNIEVHCSGEFSKTLKVSHVLQSVGRRANTTSLALQEANIAMNERSQIRVDQSGRSNVAHIFAVGDVTGGPMLAHHAVHQAKIAAEACCGMNSADHGALVPSVAYTQPEVAWVGLDEQEAKAAGIAWKSSTFPWAANGRTLAHGSDVGFSKILYDKDSQRIIGATLVGDNAGELIAEITLAIEMGANLTDLAHTIHPHPTRCETVAMAAELALGLCTDI